MMGAAKYWQFWAACHRKEEEKKERRIAWVMLAVFLCFIGVSYVLVS